MLHAVARSSQRTCEGYFGSWEWLRKRMNKHAFPVVGPSSDARSRELVQYIAYACISKS